MIKTASVPTILVVDDSQVDREIAGACVENEGLFALFAEDGDKALGSIERFEVDVVLTDLRMPNTDGLKLVEQMRRDWPNIPVILMTAYGSEDLDIRLWKSELAPLMLVR